MSMTEQKTWTEMLGRCQPGDYVDGNMWVRTMSGGWRRVLMTFDTEAQARECFGWWRRGK